MKLLSAILALASAGSASAFGAAHQAAPTAGVMRVAAVRAKPGSDLEDFHSTMDRLLVELLDDVPVVSTHGFISEPGTFDIQMTFETEKDLDVYLATTREEYVSRVGSFLDENSILYDLAGPISKHMVEAQIGQPSQIMRTASYPVKPDHLDDFKALMEDIAAEWEGGAVSGGVELTSFFDRKDPNAFVIGMTMESPQALQTYAQGMRQNFLARMQPMLAGPPTFDHHGLWRTGGSNQ